MELNDQAKLPIILQSLLEATERLQAALRRVDAEAIYDAVCEQAAVMQHLEKRSGEELEGPEKERLRRVVQKIMDLNRYNLDLSRNGLRSMRSFLSKWLPGEAYSPDGTVQPVLEETRLSTTL